MVVIILFSIKRCIDIYIYIQYKLNLETTKNHRIVAYWGQNAVYNQLKSKEFWEKDLLEFCSYNYDTIILSFLNNFFDEKNKGFKATRR